MQEIDGIDQMEFKKLDLIYHDLDQVAELIYETELAIFRPLMGLDEKSALKNIKKLLKYGNNSLGHEHVHVVCDGRENVLGISLSYGGKETSFWNDFKAYFEILDFKGFLRYLTKGTAINELLTASLDKDDYYLSNIAVDPAFRGRGIGSYILKNVIKLAAEKESRKIVLDVTFSNKGALKLYKRMGFKVYGKKSAEWIFKDEGTYNMEYIL